MKPFLRNFLILLVIFIILCLFAGCKKEENFHYNYLTLETTQVQPDAYLFGIGKPGEEIWCTNYRVIRDSSEILSLNDYKQAEKFLEMHGQTSIVRWRVPVSDSCWTEALTWSKKVSLNSCVLVKFVEINKIK